MKGEDAARRATLKRDNRAGVETDDAGGRRTIMGGGEEKYA